MATQLTQEEINAINNYSNQIKTLKDYVTAVRKMPGMYVSGTGSRAYLSMIREVYQNAIDQMILKDSPSKWAYLYYNENTLECKVYDQGLGLPFNDIERIVTTPNTSKNYEKRLYDYSSGLHGQGLKCTNALSSRLIAESYKYDGTAVRFETIEGYPIPKPNPKSIPNKDKKQGTHISFIPSTDALGDIQLDWKSVYKLAKQILVRAPIGCVVDFEAIDSQGISHKEHIINKDGIVSDLIEKTTNPIVKPITISNDNGEMKLEAAFVFDGGGKDGPDSNVESISYCNFCPCPIGTHVDGTIDGICEWFRKYMNTIYLNNKANGNGKSKKSTVVIASDIKTGLVISISAAMLEPTFIGQAKEQLGNPEMAPFCKNSVMAGLDQWSKANPKDLLTLCKFFKDIADLRIKESGEKAKIVTKYSANVLTGYPAKYAKPIKHKGEFIIVEGDSAAGTVKKARDINSQGIFPIRGKLPNAFRTSRAAFMSNEEVQGIIKIVTGKDANSFNARGSLNFDVKDIEWDKIIFMADKLHCL